jgi:hypothetical protein
MTASRSLDVAAAVTADVYAHELGPVACFSYVTRGLAASGQAELVLTLPRPADATLDRASDAPLPLLRAIAGFAARGQLVGDGGFTELGATGLFGRPALRGIAYQRAWPMTGVDLPDGALSMIVLVDHEIDAVKAYGATRVLARLGRAQRFFPTAVWCDPDRAALATADEPTLLAQVGRAKLPGVSVVMTGDRIAVRLPRAVDVPALPPPDIAIALLASLDRAADACLVWSPGQQAPEAITPPGSRGACLSGCFALFAPQQAADAFEVFEDGFALRLTDRSWAVVRDALAHHGDAVVAAPDGKRLAVEWVASSP